MSTYLILTICLRSNNGQYTVFATLMSYTETSYTSYWSTSIITVVSTVPCPIYTSYTTLTTWDCPGNCPEPPLCDPASCTTCEDGTTTILSTEYRPGDYAPAIVTSGGIAYTTNIPEDQCSSFAPFVGNGNPDGLPPCETTTSDIACIASPCYTLTSSQISEIEYTVSFTTYEVLTYEDYAPDQTAFVSLNPLETTPASFCYIFTSPDDSDFGVDTTGSCTAGNPDDDEGTTCGSSVISYSFTSDGAEYVVATTMDGHCGPYLFTGGNGANRMERVNVNLLFWLWCLAAMLSGVGMIVL
jgi:hypothetical protein